MDQKNSGLKLKRVKGDSNRYLYKRGDVYWIRASKGGRTLQKSLNITVLTTARLLRDEAVAKFFGEKRLSNNNKKLVDDLFPEFIKLKQSTNRKSTIDSITSQWETHLKDYFGNLLPDEITENEWLTYVAEKRVGYPDRKFFNDRKYLMMFLHWLHRQGTIAKLPRLPDVDPAINAGRVFSDEEISSLLDNANPDLKLQILMAVTMGMRISEILTLEWSQIDFVKKTIFLPAIKTKVNKDRRFGISLDTIDLLAARKATNGSDWVFPSPTDKSTGVGKSGNKTAWTNCRNAAKVSGRFHDLRHTFLTKAFKNSVNPALICHYAGLSLEEAQRTYLHFTTEDTRVVASLVRYK